MRGVRLSPWSMSYFTAAVVSLLLAELIWLLGLGRPLQNVGSAWVLAGVHLTTIGFLTLLMLGALHQFIPVLTETELASQRGAGATLISVAAGLIVMVVGFLALRGAVPGGVLPSVPWLLPVGGSLVVLGVAVALVNLGVTLVRAWPWQLPAWLAATGLAYLGITVMVGLLLALSLAVPKIFSPHTVAVMGSRGLASHVIGGVIGWLTVTAMGVTYKLLAMFTLSSENRGVVGWLAYVLTALGIAAAWLARWLGLTIMADVGWTAILVGLALYLWDMRALYRARKRRQLELNARYGVVPLGFLAGLIIVAAIGVRPSGTFARLDIAITFWGLYGWLGGMGLTQLYKIIPFLTWLHRYGRSMGKRRTPRVQDLVMESRDKYAFLAYYFSAAAGGAALWANNPLLFRGALLVGFLATCDIARALYHGAHPRDDEETTMAPGQQSAPSNEAH